VFTGPESAAIGLRPPRWYSTGSVNQPRIVEVDLPDRWDCRTPGNSDPIDAFAAATAVLNGTATCTPKTRDGRAEAIGALRRVSPRRRKACRQSMKQLPALTAIAPAELRETLCGGTHREPDRHLRRSPPARARVDQEPL
jgi:transposase